MTVDHGKEVHLLPEVTVPREDAGDIHHLGKPDDSFSAPEPGEIISSQPRTTHIEGCCRDASREHDQDIERRPRSLREHVLDP